MSTDFNHRGCPRPTVSLPEEASIPYPVYTSMQGKYFLGQTELLTLGQGSHAWGQLYNPPCSDVKFYVSFVSISNFSDHPITAEIWFNANPLEMGVYSSSVSPANTSLSPLPKNQVKIKSGQFVCDYPTGGVNVYDRIVPPQSTLAMDKDGKFIFGSPGNYTVFLKSPSCHMLAEARIAFGWWEDKV